MGDTLLADCPSRLTTEILADKWSAIVVFALRQRPYRHGELADLIGGISHKVLTQTLRRLQGYGLVERQVYAEAPPRVEYRLTDLGRTLIEPIAALTDWAEQHGEAVVDFQEAHQDGADGRPTAG